MSEALKIRTKDQEMDKLQASIKKMETNKNNFMKLFTMQLRYQNPLEPMNSSDMYNNIGQFAILEQQFESNKQLTHLNDAVSKQVVNASYSNLLLENIDANMATAAKTASVEEGPRSGYITIKDGDTMMQYTVDSDDIHETIIHIFNEYDQHLYSQTVDNSEGTHTFVWNGVDKNGNSLENGAKVKYKVTLAEKGGKFRDATTSLTDHISKNRKMDMYKRAMDRMFDEQRGNLEIQS